MANSMLVFFAVFAMTMAVYSVIRDVITKDKRRISNRIEEDFRAQQRKQVMNSPLFKESKKNIIATEELDDFSLPKVSLETRIEELILQSGSNMTRKDLLWQSLGFSFGLSFTSFLLFRSIFLSSATFIAGLVGPVFRLSVLRKLRQDKLRSQLPDAFDLMARVVRAGQTINQAIMAVADEFPKPIAEEFSYCFEQQNLGLSPETAVRDLARRTGVLELRIFVTALIVQQQTGGNLAEIIDKLSNLIRQRFRIMGQIKTLTAEGRFQAMILIALPILLFFTLLLLNPEYEMQLLEHPVLIYLTLTLMTFGALWIRKIINFDF